VSHFDDVPPFEQLAKTKPKANGSAPPSQKSITAAELLAAELSEVRPLCAPWIYEGVTMLAAPPKSGKTTLARQIAEAVGIGGDVFGSPCETGRTTFLSLEEGPRLFKRKLEIMKMHPDAAESLDLFWTWRQGLAGCEDLITHIKERPETRFVVVDVFAKFRQPPDKATTPYQADYDAMTGLSNVAKQFPGLAILVNHHLRKMRSLDPMDDISGTYGLTGAIDAFLVLRRQGSGGCLHAGGRLWDRDENDYELGRKDQRWVLQGVSDGLTDGEKFALNMVTKAGGMGPSELAKALDCSRQTAFERLNSLLGKGKLDKRIGVYYPINHS
jgi:RecA-family ATPase